MKGTALALYLVVFYLFPVGLFIPWAAPAPFELVWIHAPERMPGLCNGLRVSGPLNGRASGAATRLEPPRRSFS